MENPEEPEGSTRWVTMCSCDRFLGVCCIARGFWGCAVHGCSNAAGAWIAHDCMDAGDRATQEQLPRSGHVVLKGQLVGLVMHISDRLHDK